MERKGILTALSLAGGLALLFIILGGCSSSNDQSPMIDANGKHPVAWLDRHWSEYRINPNQCRSCHGSDLKGGIVNLSCFSTNIGNQRCHANGPGGHEDGFIATHFVAFNSDREQCVVCHGSYTDPAASGGVANVSCFSASRGDQSCHTSGPLHPAGYAAPALHGHLAKIDLVYCQQCHADSATPPRFAIPKTNMPAGCESAGCHSANTAHPSPWLAGRGTPANTTSHINATAANLDSSCGLCHGVGLTGGATAPSCMTTAVNGIRCHSSSPAANPTGCLSCHGNPPGGSAAPNRIGAHPKHNDLAGVAANCSVCHSGFIPDFTAGTLTHSNGTADIALSATTYMAKPAIAPVNIGGICSNVSCHGGKASPVWGVGTININTECDMCHSNDTSQYNSYNSGWHTSHNITHSIRCWDCHDTAKLSVGHFTNLATATFEQHPKATLTFKDPVTGTILNASYNQSTHTYTCTFECHNSANSTIKIHINIIPTTDRDWLGAP
ncbi:MAG: CxxxxCH/CxxCH domain-containing protein [Geobacteraceae bacterium]|nr:CxxxxCH/CxxCH domain-containing protein [Geobacteraceae bacterium]NTW78548.1 CxxxxCH/CxxCH domain-containing protein [Geobacteraceae bacterium]